MQAGDKVVWLFSAPNGYGGRGTPVPIPAIVIKVTSPQRAIVEYAYKFNGEWKRRQRTVLITTLLPRTHAAPELGE
jgi:hypothetical protein